MVACRFVRLLRGCLLLLAFDSMFVGFGFCICLLIALFGFGLGWLLL